jgi:protease-4
MVQRMLDEVHQQFIEAVRQGRGDKLRPSPDIFSGMVWTGARSVELGLADGLGSVDSVARDVIKAEQVVDYTLQPSLADRLTRRFGAAAGDAIARAMTRWSLQ